jgi:hypothetical protein
MGYPKITFFIVLKLIISLIFLYNGSVKISPWTNPEEYYMIDARFHGNYGRIIQHFMTNIIRISYKLNPASFKRTMGILEMTSVILLWVGNGAFTGGD